MKKLEADVMDFDIAIVPEHVFKGNPVCPYCNSDLQGELVEYIGDREMEAEAEMTQCSDCSEIYLITTSPLLFEATEPILTKWSVKEEKKK